MIHTQEITIAGVPTALILLPPDWSQAPQTTFAFPADVSEGVTGLQERRADAAALRTSMRYRANLSGPDLQVLRQVLGGLEGRPVAMPFWPDALCALDVDGVESTDWDARLLDGQFFAGWDGGFSNVTVTQSAPARQFRAALLVGRLSSTTLRAITDAMADITIQFREDSPWECRVYPVATDPGIWADSWEVDWSTLPEHTQRILIEHDSIGRQRLSAIDGAGDVSLWRQRATLSLARNEQRELLAFYCGRKGGVEAFNLPSALQPGVATPTAPHQFSAANGRVRFISDLQMEWPIPGLADVRIQVEQQVESVQQLQALPSYAYLYRLTYEGQSQELTDWEEPIMAAGVTWQPARIEHGRIRQSLKPQHEECEIDAYIDDVPLIAPLIRLELESSATVEIFELLFPDGAPQMLFTGTVQKARAKGRKVTLRVAAFGGALERRVPRFQWAVNCNHTLFSHGCVRRRPTEMEKEGFRAVGYFEAQWPDPKLLLKDIVYPSSPAPADHYYVGGWVETGSGANRQVREILGSWHVSGVLHLLLARPIRTDQITAGQSFHVYPGCDGQRSTCVSKFGNLENFGGFPFLPEWISQAPSSFPKTGK